MNSLLNLPEWHDFCAKYRYNLFAFAVDVVGIYPTWQQKILFDSISFDGSRVSVASGHGCFAKGTLIRLANGKKKVVELITHDDQIMGENGEVRNVTDVVSGIEEMFKFTLGNGLERTFNKSHVLQLVALKTAHGWCRGDTVKVKVSKWLKWTKQQKKQFGFKQVKNRNYKNPIYLKIKSAVSQGIGTYYGFSLFESSTFLDADGLILENTGKTASAGVTALWHLLCFQESIMMFTAPQIGQLKKQVWKEIEISLTRMKNGVFGWLASYVSVLSDMVYIKGSQKSWHVFAKTAPKNQETNIAGNHGDNYCVWFDEASGISDGVFNIALGALTHADNRAVMTSQPSSSTGMFYDTHHRLSSKNGGDWIALRFNGEDSPIVSLKSLQEQLRKYSNRDDPQYKIRVLGEFPELLGQFLIGMSKAELCFTGKTALRRKHSGFGYVISVDVGGGVGRDDSVITVCRMWGSDQFGDEERHVDILDIPLCKNTDSISELVTAIEQLLTIYPNVSLVVDENGTGRGLGQRLRELGIDFVPVNWGAPCFGKADRQAFVNKRARAYIGLKNAIERGKFKIRITNSVQRAKILEQMTAIPFVMDEQVRWKVLSKQDMKRLSIKSPDILDTFAFLFMAEVSYFEADTAQKFMRSAKADTIDQLEKAYDQYFKR